MQAEMVVWLGVGVLAGLVAGWLIARGQAAELRQAVADAREREQAQMAKVAESAAQLTSAMMAQAVAQRDAEAAVRRADEMIEKEREAPGERIVAAKDGAD